LIWVVFKQSFKNLKNEIINFSKVILKLECLFYLNIYILFYLILYSKRYFDSNKSKKRSNRKKITPYNKLLFWWFQNIFYCYQLHFCMLSTLLHIQLFVLRLVDQCFFVQWKKAIISSWMGIWSTTTLINIRWNKNSRFVFN